MLIHSDPNDMNSIVYHLIIVRYSMRTLHWYFPWATASHLYNMTGRGEKLQQLHCYHRFSDSLDIYLTKNHYENYSPKMVPIAKIWGSGSWTINTNPEISCQSDNLAPTGDTACCRKDNARCHRRPHSLHIDSPRLQCTCIGIAVIEIKTTNQSILDHDFFAWLHVVLWFPYDHKTTLFKPIACCWNYNTNI